MHRYFTWLYIYAHSNYPYFRVRTPAPPNKPLDHHWMIQNLSIFSKEEVVRVNKISRVLSEPFREGFWSSGCAIRQVAFFHPDHLFGMKFGSRCAGFDFGIIGLMWVSNHCNQCGLHPRNLTKSLKNNGWKTTFLLGIPIFKASCYFQGG